MSTPKFNQERLMQVLLAPQISEKATYIADKNEQVIFIVAPDATKPEIKAAVELLFKVQVEVGSGGQHEGQGQAFWPHHGSPQRCQEGICLPEARPGNQFRRRGGCVNGTRQSQADFRRPSCRRQGRQPESAQGAARSPRWSRRRTARLAATIMAISPRAIRAVATSSTIVWLISSATRMAYPPRWSASNTIRTVPPNCVAAVTPTVSAATSSPPRAWLSVRRCSAVRRRRSRRATPCRSAISRSARTIHCIEMMPGKGRADGPRRRHFGAVAGA